MCCEELLIRCKTLLISSTNINPDISQLILEFKNACDEISHVVISEENISIPRSKFPLCDFNFKKRGDKTKKIDSGGFGGIIQSERGGSGGEVIASKVLSPELNIGMFLMETFVSTTVAASNNEYLLPSLGIKLMPSKNAYITMPLGVCNLSELINFTSPNKYLRKLKSKSHIQNDVKVEWSGRIINAVRSLHENNIVHGDLKLSNVVMTSKSPKHTLILREYFECVGRVKRISNDVNVEIIDCVCRLTSLISQKFLTPRLGDFGLSTPSVSNRLHSAFTLNFRAPEEWNYEKNKILTDRRASDLWSLGLVIYAIFYESNLFSINIYAFSKLSFDGKISEIKKICTKVSGSGGDIIHDDCVGAAINGGVGPPPLRGEIANFNFDKTEWSKISLNVRQLIVNLIQFNPERRLSLTGCLEKLNMDVPKLSKISLSERCDDEISKVVLRGDKFTLSYNEMKQLFIQNRAW